MTFKNSDNIVFDPFEEMDRKCRNITAFKGYPIVDVDSLDPNEWGTFRTYKELEKNFRAEYKNGVISFSHGISTPKVLRSDKQPRSVLKILKKKF